MLGHLLELRRRALQVILYFILFFTLFFFWANDLFHALLKPLIANLPSENYLIATQIASPVLTPLKLAANAALLCTTPIILLQLWYFTAPGLYHQERYHLRGAMIMSLVLFCLGILFAYFLILPFLFQFFVKALPLGVKFLPDITCAVDFITHMLLLFGVCFQVPLLCLILVRLQWVELDSLKKIRPYIIVLAFIVGMLLTPPDVLSQIMLAVPLCLLYELGILLASSRFFSQALSKANRY